MKKLNRVLVFTAIVAMLPDLCRAQGYTIKTVAGGGSAVGNGGPATSAFVVPQGVAVDASGNLYISEPGYNLIRRVTADGIISPFAGTLGASGYAGDGGPALGAEFQFPSQLAFDAAGNLYVADQLAGRVRKITANGIISTLAGGVLIPSPNRGDGGPATNGYLGLPTGVATDGSGNVYIADASAQDSIRKVSSDGTITTFAGGPLNFNLTGSIGDGGPATAAVLVAPRGVTVDAHGNVFIADTFNNRIRKVTPAGIISTVAGSGAASYSGDGGPATQAGLDQPQAVAVDSDGNLYIADTGDQRIRLVTPDGTITTIAGNGQVGNAGDGGPATSATLDTPVAIAVGAGGTIYFANSGANRTFPRVSLLTPPTHSGGGTPTISAGGVFSASAFGQFTSIAPGSWIEIYGSNLAPDTRSWGGQDFNGANAPTSLDGTKVTIGGQPAFVDYISPTQVNAQTPSNIGIGPQPLVVTTTAGGSNTYAVTVNATEPGLLAPASFNIGGKQYVVAVFSDGITYALPPGAILGLPARRAQAGDVMTFYGVGFGAVTPNTPAGQVVQQSNALALSFHVFFGQTEATVGYAGLAPSAVGLYQFNVVVPLVSSSDTVPITFTLGGVQGAQTLYTAVQ